MKLKCAKCELEDVGRYNNLVKKGWKVFFLFDMQKVARCKKCKPNLKDKLKSKVNKDYKPEMYYDIKEKINKMKILKGLKTKEEKRDESWNRGNEKRKKYNYKRNIHKKKGSKKYG